MNEKFTYRTVISSSGMDDLRRAKCEKCGRQVRRFYEHTIEESEGYAIDVYCCPEFDCEWRTTRVRPIAGWNPREGHPRYGHR